MASGTSLVDIVIPDWADQFSGLDMKDYFYQFVISEQRMERNTLAGEVTLDEARTIFGPSFEWPEPRLAVSLATLAMGDLNSVEFAQASRLGLCLASKVLVPAELLSMRCPVPGGPLMLGTVIDDLVAIEMVVKGVAGEGARSMADERIARALSGSEEASLQRNPFCK